MKGKHKNWVSIFTPRTKLIFTEDLSLPESDSFTMSMFCSRHITTKLFTGTRGWGEAPCPTSKLFCL